MGGRISEKGDGNGKFNRGGIPTVFYCKLTSRLKDGGGGGYSHGIF